MIISNLYNSQTFRTTTKQFNFWNMTERIYVKTQNNLKKFLAIKVNNTIKNIFHKIVRKF